MASGYRVRIYYGEISRLYQRGGPGDGWIYRVSVAMINESRLEAPTRSGDLKRSHYVERSRANQYAATYNIGNTAEHAEWVHQGTARWIYPTSGTFLSVPVAPGSRQRSKKPRVRGQDPNPWLDRACTRVAMRYGAV